MKTKDPQQNKIREKLIKSRKEINKKKTPNEHKMGPDGTIQNKQRKLS